MTKYEPLTRHLASRGGARIVMTFADMEAVLGFKLPKSARDYRPWWANSAHGHVQSRGWLDAGYQSEQVDLASERLVFAKLNATLPADNNVPHTVTGPKGRHPLIGCMVGMITIAPGVDLTDPMYTDKEMEEFLNHKIALLEGRDA
ncbi:MAG: DUF7662 domain-containing protein [Gemmobacter sp.]